MSHPSPLRPQHEAYARSLKGRNEPSDTGITAETLQRPGAAVGHRLSEKVELEYLQFGPDTPQADSSSPGPQLPCEILATYGDVEPEYAAIRRGAALLDSPHRGTIRIRGSQKDRRDFLNRMITQELKDLAPGIARQAFWLNRKGRIEADLLLMELGDALWVDLDLHQAPPTTASLREFLFAEDVDIQDVSSEFHHIAIHGKLADEVLAAASGQVGFSSDPLCAATLTIDNCPCIVARRDQTGEKGYALVVPRESAPGVWEFLLATDHIVGQDRRRVRPIGWHAYNIARIEAGTPLYNIDFGPTNLPHETGVLRERVSFTKGCYLGQEIVARMESLGQPKQKLVGLKVLADVLPVAESHVYERSEGGMGAPVGTITSSTLSPMLGAASVAFAMIKSSKANDGEKVIVAADNEQAEAVIGPLRFWPQ